MKAACFAAIAIAALCATTITVSLAEPAFSLNKYAPDIALTIDQEQLIVAAQNGNYTLFEGHRDSFNILKELAGTIDPTPGAMVILR